MLLASIFRGKDHHSPTEAGVQGCWESVGLPLSKSGRIHIAALIHAARMRRTDQSYEESDPPGVEGLGYPYLVGYQAAMRWGGTNANVPAPDRISLHRPFLRFPVHSQKVSFEKG